MRVQLEQCQTQVWNNVWEVWEVWELQNYTWLDVSYPSPVNLVS